MAPTAFSVLLTSTETEPVVLAPYNEAYNKAKVPAQFKLNGVSYMRKKEVATVSKPRKQGSKVWQYGETLLQLPERKEVYYCYDCEVSNRKQLLPVLNGTKPARNHMESVHKRDPETGVVSQSATVNQQPVYSLVQVACFDTFKLLLIRWFVFCQMALFMLENVYFRELITYLHKGLGGLLPKSAKTLRNWLIAEYDKQKKSLAAELSFTLSRIHITFDIWTAGNFVGFISIWAYWIDKSGVRQRRLLAFRRIYGSHSGENQSEVLLEVLKEYEIEDRLGYMVCDNASSNTTAIDLLLYELDPTITEAQIKARRLRCFGHIVNLAAQSLLAGRNAELKKAQEELEIDDEDYGHQSRRWIHQGPLGKVQRLVKYVLASPQRREEFGALSGGRKVAQFDHLGVSYISSCYWYSRCSKSKVRQASFNPRRIAPTAQSNGLNCGQILRVNTPPHRLYHFYYISN
jgi:hypothetical protein